MSTPDLLDLRWRKSSHSSGQGGDCVEVADLTSAVVVRDSKDPEGSRLAFDFTAWHAFMLRVKSSQFDLEC
ncbi:DUF397 domain-containing protein [Actinomadura syzygii]|uniref:DUF397 domain-containing protein n=1 Tax=Actinomadura syzygii TaxID=1427538 RepID=A0A5D0TX51_9ACTN|nr:DUF397 domain-containing protein [Actinomadura syzygii]TYC09429.1 DUF397 domain-containing protein [Actinomadura syzygii]